MQNCKQACRCYLMFASATLSQSEPSAGRNPIEVEGAGHDAGRMKKKTGAQAKVCKAFS
jgi:hypothetical protein